MTPSQSSPAIEPPSAVRLETGRFARLEAIEWWDQTRLSRSRVLVVGAGALGNEIVKNLSLLGVQHIVLIDMDHVEKTNLCRSVLFREEDEGKPKALCAARAAQQIYPDSHIRALVGNVLADVGLGYFRWADAVLGALDNREARVFVNAACARVGRPWFDGGIEVLHGVMRGFAPPHTACYECTMSQVDWNLLNQRRSCSLLARRAVVNRGTPTTPTTASVIAGLQVQEWVKLLHDQPALLGSGFVFDGAEHTSYRVAYPINPDCPWHETPAPIESMPQFNSQTPLVRIWEAGVLRLGGLDAIDLAREIVERVKCARCAFERPVFQPAEKLDEKLLQCPQCQTELAPIFLHSVTPTSALLKMTAEEIGLPPWDIVWPRYGFESIGFEITGDDPSAAAPGKRSLEF